MRERLGKVLANWERWRSAGDRRGCGVFGLICGQSGATSSQGGTSCIWRNPGNVVVSSKCTCSIFEFS